MMGQLSGRIESLSPEKRALLARRLRQRGSSFSTFPLSFAQERLWFLDQIQPGNSFYNISLALRLCGPLRPDAMAAALAAIAQRHEALRTTFLAIDGQPVQKVAPRAALSLPRVDLRRLEEHHRRAAAEALAHGAAQRPFALAAGPLVRCRLLQLAAEEHVLVLTVHHIVADGWSIGVLVRELSALYGAALEGCPAALPALPIQYPDFAHWQRRTLRGERHERQLEFWRRRLADLPKLELATDHPRPKVPRYRGRRVPFALSPALSAALRDLAKRSNATLFMTLLSAFDVLLARYTGSRDVVVGTAVANRRRQTEPLIGFFVNTLVLRLEIPPVGFDRLLESARRTILEALANQDLPFEKLVWELQPERDLSHNPLFQVLFAVENAPLPDFDLPGLEVSPFSSRTETAKFDLHLDVWERDGRILLVFEYNIDLFDATTITRMAGHLERLLEAVAERPGTAVDRLPLLGRGERHQLAWEWPDVGPASAERGRAEHRLAVLFAAQATQRPDAVAVSCDARQLSYGELGRRARRLAGRLRRLVKAGAAGTGERIVAVALERSPEWVVAILATLEAGAAYLPLDPEAPRERLAGMLRDAGAAGLVAQEGLLPWLEEAGLPVVRLAAATEVDGPEDAADGAEDGECSLSPPGSAGLGLAYVMYTSGSTGRPKGVAVPQRAVARLLRRNRFARFAREDVFLGFAPAAFDASTLELWGALANGARLALVPPGRISPRRLAGELARQRMSVAWLTAALFHRMVDEELERLGGLRLVLAGGDVLSPPRVARLLAALPATTVINGYGPTENTTFTCCHRLPPGSAVDSPLPIGRPIARSPVRVLDARLRPVAAGVAGELCAAGDGLARGYHGRPAATAERFVPDPLAAGPGARLYRTGDLVRWRTDGALSFLGRIDQQVKIRGFRVEPGEVEAVLRRHPWVRDAAVVARRGAEVETGDGGGSSADGGEARLVAYVVVDPEPALAAGPEGDGQAMEMRDSHVAGWQEIFESTYGRGAERAAEEGRGGGRPDDLDLAGWISSYTGEPIPAVQMREWIDATLAPILAFGPRRVLEVGCGTGLLLLRLAPSCERYVGTDISRRVLAGLRRKVEAAGLAHVELEERRAEDWSGLGRGSFDAVVLSSVVQYFSGAEALADVLRGAARVLAPGGRIFLDDVRSLPLLATFHASVELHRAPPGAPADALRRRIERALGEENELAVAPELFTALGEDLPKIGEVRIWPKAGRARNEMSCFRYRVEMRAAEPDTAETAETVAWLDWRREQLDAAALRRLLAAEGPEILGLARVRNARIVTPWIEAARRSEPSAEEAEPEEAAPEEAALEGAAPEEAGIAPDELHALAEEAGYVLETSWARHGAEGDFDAVLRPRRLPPGRIAWPRTAELREEPRAWHRWANDPLRSAFARWVVPALRRFLARRLPEPMLPTAFVTLDELPLNPHGKVDRRTLPAPDSARPELETAYAAPRDATEERLCALWSEILGIDTVGIDDGFFKLGGHSLLATQLVARLRGAFEVELPLQTLFEHPTVAALAAEIEAARRAAGPRLPPLRPAARDRAPPLSFAQERLWFLDRLAPGDASYNEPVGLAALGRLDVAALGRALELLAHRHEPLRTRFPESRGRPVQRVEEPVPLELPVIDLSALDAARRRRTAGHLARLCYRLPFDLARGPLWRATLLRLRATAGAPGEHHLLLTLHHIVFDGWSTGILVRELRELYAAAVEGRTPRLPTLPVQYADFAAWQRSWLRGTTLDAEVAWWRRRLEDLPALDLPTDRRRPAIARHRGGRLPVVLPAELAEGLRRLGRGADATLFMTCLAVFGALLQRYSGQARVAVGSPISGRNHTEVEGLVGFFVNMLVVVVDGSGDPPFAAFLERVRETTLGVYGHQDLPFERLVEELQPERDLGSNPLFQVLFQVLSLPPSRLEMPGLTLAPLATGAGSSKFDLSLSLTDAGGLGGGGIGGWLERDTDLFDDTTARRLLGHYRRLVVEVLADPARRLSELPLLNRSERHQLRHELGGGPAAEAGTDAANLGLHGLFAARAARMPDAAALVHRGHVLTYGHLAARAARLAAVLRRHLAEPAAGGGAEPCVAICAARTPELVTALLATLAAGAAYVPLDPAYPAARNRFVLEDCRARLLLAQRRVAAGLGTAVPVVDLDSVLGSGHGHGAPPAPAPIQPDRLAYVIYTSGSTGRPKGVAIAHRSAAALVRWAATAFAPEELEAVVASTSVCFDLSVFELFVPLALGGRIVLVDDALELAGATVSGRPSLLDTVPSTARELLRLGALPASLRSVSLAGEPLPGPLLDALLERPGIARVRNLYGPSEDTTYSTVAVFRQPVASPEIGWPVAGTRTDVADRRGRLQPLGVPGELLLAGCGLARGYLHRPALTAERFLPDPRAARPGERLYRTGDLVRRRGDGRLDFLGRLDHQVKIRGHRIELGEIEAALDSAPRVAESAVVLAPEGATDGAARLVAYVAGDDPRRPPQREAVLGHLGEHLPAVMVPSALEVLDVLPRTANGKLDRAALPAMRETAPAAAAAPRDPLEEALAGIWSEVLGVEAVGIHDRFFDLGGHSLLATRAISRVRDLLGVEVALRELFLAPTVADFGRAVRAALAGESPAPQPPPLRPGTGENGPAEPPLSFGQERLWFLQRLEPRSGAYNMALALRFDGPLRPDWLAAALSTVVRRHGVLRSAFPTVEGRPVQRVEPPLPVALPRIDLRRLAPAARHAAARRLAAGQAAQPFDLAAGRPLRALLLALGSAEEASAHGARHVLLLTLHHIVSDGWSMGILLREVVAAYQALAAGRPPALPALTLQYADYARWQRSWLRGAALDAHLLFWKGHLANAPPALELPSDRPRPALRSFRGGRRRLAFGAGTGAALRSLARRRGATPFMVLASAVAAWLHRLSQQADVVLGTTVANRTRSEVEGLVGFFANTLALRARCGAARTFGGLLAQLRETALAAYAHQDLPFEKLVEELRPERELAHTPLFQVLLTLQNTPSLPTLELPGLRLTALEPDEGGTKFDLGLILRETGEGLAGSLSYSADLFDPTTAERLAGQCAAVLAAALERPEDALGELPLLTAAARHQLLVEHARDGDFDPPVAAEAGLREACVHELFAARAAAAPDRLAVVAEGEALSYGALAARAGRLARHLRGLGVGPEARVATVLERRPELVVAILAVLRAGGAYVALESAHPAARLASLARRAGAVATLCAAARLEELGQLPRPIAVDVPGTHEAGEDRPAPGPRQGREAAVAPANAAYCLFTSGSTGTPKGVVVEHRQLSHYRRAIAARFGPAEAAGEPAAYAMISTVAADLGHTCLYPALCGGGTLHLISETRAADPAALGRYLESRPVDWLKIVPGHLRTLHAYQERPALPRRRLVLGGEAAEPGWLAELVAYAAVAGCEVHNHYGPTESTVGILTARLGPDTGHLGRPLRGAAVYLRDPHLRPVPFLVPGELLLGGDGLARGYLGQPAATAERFVPDPFGPRPGARLYRSGDLARRRGDGRLEFLGRTDDQVKIRGFRVEPGEIEAVLRRHPGLRDAAVASRRTSSEAVLAAFVAAEPGAAAPDAAALRAFLGERLPAPMVPSLFAVLEALPRTANGKIDRRALLAQWPTAPGAAPARHPAAVAAAGHVAPSTGSERLLAVIWQRVLEVEQVGVDDNFFDLGGHSLAAVRVQGELQRELGRPVELLDLFRHPTVRRLARSLEPAVARGAGPGLAHTEVTGTAAAGNETAGNETAANAIAVIGLAGAFPGASDPEALWENLAAGVESITFFSEEELRAAGLPEEMLADPRLVAAHGALGGIDLFDADFFGFAPREAEITDPQHRLFLEHAWKALENAGYDPARYAGRIGIYGGAGVSSYLFSNLMPRRDLLIALGADQVRLANRPDNLATRVAYKLGLRGPALTVQTVCSTSLVAVHLACRALIGGECDMALAGGVSITVPETAAYIYREAGLLSPDGHCRAFDAAAAGVVAGNGVGVVTLKRLADARASGDPIRAVIRGTAVTNDGADKVGFTAPGVAGQAAAIRAAQAMAGVEPRSITYVEAHGTGTRLGDPIEVAALAEAFGGAPGSPGAGEPAYCALGSVKTNLGHLDAAAGIAGLIKTVLALQHGALPPSLHCEEPNPRLGLAGSPFYVNTRLRPWEPAPGAPRRAGVSSFGIGGTNAHAVVEEAPPPGPAEPSRRWQVLALSALSPGALERATDALARHLERDAGRDGLADVAFTLWAGRRRLPYRRALLCRDRADAAAALRARDPRRLHDSVQESAETPVAFFLPGLGELEPGHTRQLYATEPTFRHHLDACAEILSRGWDLDPVRALYGERPGGEDAAAPAEAAPPQGIDLRRLLGRGGASGSDPAAGWPTRVAQPLLFAVEYALAQMWREWGIEPRLLLGYSLGEYVAAALAGTLRLDDALRLVAERARWIDALPAGALLGVALPEEEARQRIQELEIAVAAVNAPLVTVVGGPPAAVSELARRLAVEEVVCRRLPARHAFHTPALEPVAGRLTELAASLELRPPAIPWISNVSGAPITEAEAVDPTYWARHLCGTVRFAEGLGAALREADALVLLEAGPGQTLSSLVWQHPERRAGHVAVPTLPPGGGPESESAEALGALARAWLAGAPVDADGLYRHERRRRVPLPAYPFEKRRFWVEAPARRGAQAPAAAEASAQREAGRVEPAGRAPADAAGEATAPPGAHPDFAPPRSAGERRLAEVWRELLGVARLGRRDNFFELGGSSLLAVRLAARLEEVFGVVLGAEDILRAPTLEELAGLLEGRAGGAGDGGAAEATGAEPETSSLVEIRRGDGALTPLFLFHPAGGYVLFYRALADALATLGAVYGLQARGLAAGEEPSTSIEEMARRYVAAIRARQPRGPYRLGGSSLGGTLAWEAALRLRAAGAEVELLALMDTPGPDDLAAAPEDLAAVLEIMLGGAVGVSAEELRRLGPEEEQLAHVVERGRAAGALPPELDLPRARRLVEVFRANDAALRAYRPPAYDGPVVYFRARHRRPADPPYPERPWIELADGGLELHRVAGDHLSMFRPPQVAELAARLDSCLARFRETGR